MMKKTTGPVDFVSGVRTRKGVEWDLGVAERKAGGEPGVTT